MTPFPFDPGLRAGQEDATGHIPRDIYHRTYTMAAYIHGDRHAEEQRLDDDSITASSYQSRKPSGGGKFETECTLDCKIAGDVNTCVDVV